MAILHDLAEIGIKTVADLAESPSDLLSSIVGTATSKLKSLAMGIDLSPILTDPSPTKSYGRQETFDKNISSLPLLKNTLRSMADALMLKIRSEAKMVGKAEIVVRFGDMKQIRRSTSFVEPTDLETDVYETLDGLLEKAFVNTARVRMIGLKFSDVHKIHHPRQTELGFLEGNHKRARALASASDEIRHRHGPLAIFRGHHLSRRSKRHP